MNHGPSLLTRLGTFLLLVGVGLLLMFLGSELGQEADFNYFFLGLALVLVGLVLRRRGRTASESRRFQSLRRLRSRRRPGPEEPKEEENP